MPDNGVVDGITLLGEGYRDLFERVLLEDRKLRHWEKARVMVVSAASRDIVVVLVRFFGVPTKYFGNDVSREHEAVYVVSDEKVELLRGSFIYGTRDRVDFQIVNGSIYIFMYDFLEGKRVRLQFLWTN